jgi:uroporphyrinogen III methyltransferase/synthase
LADTAKPEPAADGLSSGRVASELVASNLVRSSDVARLPLAGKRILVTRPEERGEELCEALRKAGAVPVHIPFIVIRPIEQFSSFDEAVDQLRPGDWIVVTSPRGVDVVFFRLRMRRRELIEAGGAYMAAVGPGTAEFARMRGLRVDFVPSAHNGVSIANELGERLRGRRVLLPRSDKASSDLPEAVRQHGGEPLDVVAYRTVSTDLDDFWQRIKEAEVDAITLFSPSQAQVLRRMGTLVDLAEWQGRVPILAIGEVTAAACRKFGIQTPLVAADATVAAVIATLSKHFAAMQNGNSPGADQR